MNLVENFMRQPVKSVLPELSIRDTAKAMLSEGLSALFVREENNGNFIGIVTNTDLADLAIAMEINPDNTPVKELMKAPIISVDRYEHIMDAGKAMREKGIRHLAVTEEDEIIGMLCIADVLSHQLSVVRGESPNSS
ncbi:hypothetical protein UR09_06160 [Candidatus Nitromaritima sp. SCGC AAA799-A02]|nr:hypothetical protein UR09_06160 [Candidatus Nitromaritima sp. SCGC AAA799-A02]KMP11816.1 hypothetical protein UZ36_03060 [Candidatus Nitromaritima sp. SCGC AAA799-C22]